MSCLTESHIQALADGEGTGADRTHAASCAACGAKVRARAALMASITESLSVPVELDPDFRLKAEATEISADGIGATRLRPTSDPPRFRFQTGRWIYGAGLAAAVVVAVLFIAPSVRKTDSTVSASEILAKSANQLSAAVTSGIELLEYELKLDGVPKEMIPDQMDGTYKIWQAIDHDVPGRFRFTSYDSAGRMFSSIAEDPITRRRVASFPSEGQRYRFDVTLPEGARNLSLPEMQRLHMQASITMMQASGQQLFETIDGPHGKLYRIEVPRVTGPGTNPIWDLTEARVVIDSRDYHVVEFAVQGTFLRQSYSLSYKLIRYIVGAKLSPDAFAVPEQPGEIVITGEGTPVPTHDVVVLALRELAKAKQKQGQ